MRRMITWAFTEELLGEDTGAKAVGVPCVSKKLS